MPDAGLLPAAVLAQRVDLGGVVDRRLRLARHGANSGAKALTVIGAMLAGGDSIDDTALLRAGAAGSLFDGTRAPSTVGSWLRAHKWSNVRQLDAISRELLARLWGCGAGPADLTAPLTIDIDSTIVAVHGRAKQGAAFGYTKVRCYHPQLATCAETGQVLMCRLRGGSAGAARGAASLVTETISRVRNAGATGALTVRADSAFYSKSMLSTAAKFDVRFSITARQDPRVRAAIEAIDEGAWQQIPYWLSTPEVSGADIAETPFTVFASDKTHARGVRLVVRRVRPTPGSQLALFTTWDHHAFVTDRDLPLAEVEADHRRHAVVEQNIAELTSAGLAHLPSGRFMANAAWLALAVMAHNLGRAIALLAGPALARATAATLRRTVFTMPGRLIHTGRRRHLRLPQSWPWAAPILLALTRIHAIPLRR
ncbi:IS1380 family transposase [Rhodococcus antarcticus]|uniref:IS1380 family transposase n=1 Tax=Rhodococcus antarcticus TaxID=2987751 RepID=A0ABY6NYV4_9NOCA|nr:IS1380 family transposase [Rhodococcus antarcticus]UZJ24569.1 IS1380 family transposase [Rhodococcus antarcticus]